jgi:hypothetical protein
VQALKPVSEFPTRPDPNIGLPKKKQKKKNGRSWIDAGPDHLGQQLAANAKPESPYREWVETYSSAEFEALARRLEVLLDRYGGDHDRLAVLYHRAMELELRFFDGAGQWAKP